jgi:hypothetical protein
LLVFGLWLASENRPAGACTLCVGFPEKSAADFLIESDSVALAREDPRKPFSLAPVEFLKGKNDGTEIDLFLDSVTRRALASDTSRTVVVVQPKRGSPWRRVAVANSEYKAVVRRIILFAPEWQGESGRLRRAQFFAQLFGHEDPAIYDLAYVEMARAPYHVIKRLSRVVAREQIERILDRPQYIEWRSLAILLVAHRGAAADREYIARSFRTAEQFCLSTNLAALAAASIELDGAQAVSFIEDRYFLNPDRKKEELTEVLKALSLHAAEGRTDLRESIVKSYGRLLEFHPEMAAAVAGDLLAWRRFEFKEKLARIEATNTDLEYSERKLIRQYLRQAVPAE